MERLLLKPDEAAKMLGIGKSKAYALLASGDLPCVTVGRSRRVPVAALEAWVARNTVVRGAVGGERREPAAAER